MSYTISKPLEQHTYQCSVLTGHVTDGIWNPCTAVRRHCTPHAHAAAVVPSNGRGRGQCVVWSMAASSFYIRGIETSAPEFHPENRVLQHFHLFIFYFIRTENDFFSISVLCMSARLYGEIYWLEALIDDALPQCMLIYDRQCLRDLSNQSSRHSFRSNEIDCTRTWEWARPKSELCEEMTCD